ncbi:hypothetical protein [Micromonospora avicenniae]|uniref:hypothetical protein n=1 Tax=Micromonospora avicenniae TaxID=1198245 RepID=UPI0034235D52
MDRWSELPRFYASAYGLAEWADQPVLRIDIDIDAYRPAVHRRPSHEQLRRQLTSKQPTDDRDELRLEIELGQPAHAFVIRILTAAAT